jgi:Holliday junction DNA helicase RuvA
MIGRIRGVLAARRSESATVDVGGIGYEIRLTPRSLASLPGLGEEVVVHTHTHVREDELTLYGFETEKDRDLFRVLLGASGVGPKVAMAMLATLDHNQIVRAIASDDADALTATPGVGKRGAQRIVLELGPKLAGRDADLSGSDRTLTVRQALESLGYTTDEINQVVGEVDPNDTIEIQVKTALQALGRR